MNLKVIALEHSIIHANNYFAEKVTPYILLSLKDSGIEPEDIAHLNHLHFAAEHDGAAMDPRRYGHTYEVTQRQSVPSPLDRHAGTVIDVMAVNCRRGRMTPAELARLESLFPGLGRSPISNSFQEKESDVIIYDRVITFADIFSLLAHHPLRDEFGIYTRSSKDHTIMRGSPSRVEFDDISFGSSGHYHPRNSIRPSTVDLAEAFEHEDNKIFKIFTDGGVSLYSKNDIPEQLMPVIQEMYSLSRIRSRFHLTDHIKKWVEVLSLPVSLSAGVLLGAISGVVCFAGLCAISIALRRIYSNEMYEFYHDMYNMLACEGDELIIEKDLKAYRYVSWTEVLEDRALSDMDHIVASKKLYEQ